MVRYTTCAMHAHLAGTSRNFTEAAVAMAWDRQVVLVDVPVLPAAPLQVS